MNSYKWLLSTVLGEYNPNESTINTYQDVFDIVRRYQFETSTTRKLSVMPSIPILPFQHQQSYLKLNTK